MWQCPQKKIGGTSRRHVDVDVAPGLNLVIKLMASAHNRHIGGSILPSTDVLIVGN